MNEKFQENEWVEITEEYLKIYPYNRGKIGIILGYGWNPRNYSKPTDTKLVIVKWVGHVELGYVLEKILVAL